MKCAMILFGIATLLAGELVRADEHQSSSSASFSQSIDANGNVTQRGGGSGASPIRPEEIRAAAQAARAEAIKARDDALWSLGRGRKLEKASYLGLSTTPVTAALRAQLTLQPYVDLVVESVEKDSPAAAAGVEQYDILEQFNDQILIEPRQLGVLVRLAKPGDQVTLKILRKGASMALTAKIIERDVPPLDNGLFERMQFLNPDQAVTIQKTREPMDRALQVYRLNTSGNGSFNYSDKGLSLNITTDGDDRHLVAKEHGTGKVLFDGPINTPADRKGLPAEVAKRMKEMDPSIFELAVEATTKP